VSQSTVAKYMPRRDTPPSQSWRTFLANHVGQIMAADLFVVPTVTYRLLFVLVRRLDHAMSRSIVVDCEAPFGVGAPSVGDMNGVRRRRRQWTASVVHAKRSP
jgi:hypothetical protein